MSTISPTSPKRETSHDRRAMIDAGDFIAAARAGGLDFYAGAPSEGEAVAIASGAWLAGRQTVVMCQNSGLGNAVNPLTSLNAPFRIPTLLIVTWRGEPGLKDEPQHDVMGEITDSLLDVIRIAHAAFPSEASAIGPTLDRALGAMAE